MSPEPPGARGRSSPPARRGQSEVYGVALLTGVVAIVALTVGAFVVAGTGGDAAGPTTDIVLDVTASDVVLTHNGGDPLDVGALTVLVRHGGTETRFAPDPTDTDDGDARLVPGDAVRLTHGVGDGDLTVLVVHERSNTVLLDDSSRVPG